MRELHELLRHYAGSEQRYKDFVQSMRNSTLTAFYTPPAIVRALAEALRDAGVVPRQAARPQRRGRDFPFVVPGEPPTAKSKSSLSRKTC
ncbi:hypothetical protein [Alistipes communis]|uniref:hypothetical protein n=1 Tax=Alistipes communis TaxID=2585118 RepID=UPI002431A37B|nr:hypothetical protein [Alistipes communis]